MAENTSLPPTDQLTYEQAFNELESIIGMIENSNPTLEESMLLFERGQLLVAHCAKLLDQAELRVQNLSDIADNNLQMIEEEG